MAPPQTLTSRLKVQLKLSITRLRMVQQKDTAIAKQQRRAMALLLEQGKLESARIKIENIIRSDLETELHEILELYCELLLARIGLLDPNNAAIAGGSSGNRDPHPPCDPGLEEAVHSIIHAAPRTDVKELHQVRALLIERFGKDFGIRAAENKDNTVAPRVLSRLTITPPAPDLVDAYLREIARTYDVPFPGDDDKAATNDEDDEDEDDEGGAKEPPIEADAVGTPGTEELSRASAPKDPVGGPTSPAPVRVAPPSPSTENVAPKLKLNAPSDAPKAKPKAAAGASKPAAAKDKGPGGKIPDVDELARRFAELKK